MANSDGQFWFTVNALSYILKWRLLSFPVHFLHSLLAVNSGYQESSICLYPHKISARFFSLNAVFLIGGWTSTKSAIFLVTYFMALTILNYCMYIFSSIVLNCFPITNSANKYVQDTSVNLNRVMSLFSGAKGVIHCFVSTICFRSLGLNGLTQLNAHLLSDAKKLEYL